MLVDVTIPDLLERRACVSVSQMFRINRLEIWLLLAMHGYFQLFGVSQVGKTTLFRMVTGHPKAKRQMEGYWFGLCNRGFVEVGLARGRGHCWVITALGWQVIEAYKRSLNKLIERYDVKGIKQAA